MKHNIDNILIWLMIVIIAGCGVIGIYRTESLEQRVKQLEARP